MPANGRSCKTCQFYEELPKNKRIDFKPWSWCRRHAPTADNKWPEVWSGYWCGEWQKDKAP